MENYFGENFYELEDEESMTKKVLKSDKNHNGPPFVQTPVNTILSSNQVSSIFFSKQNMDAVQNKIIELVYTKSKGEYQISRQSDKQLNLIMRSIYLQHSKNLNTNIKQQVIELNTRVLKYCIDTINVEILQYLGYLKDINEPLLPMDRPINISQKGENLVELKSFM